MSNIISKIFENLLNESSKIKDLNEYSKKLEERIVVLEKQVSILACTTHSLMESITVLAQNHATNRQSLEEIYNFVTNPEPEFSDQSDQDDKQVSNETIEKYKKLLN